MGLRCRVITAFISSVGVITSLLANNFKVFKLHDNNIHVEGVEYAKNELYSFTIIGKYYSKYIEK